MTLQIKLLNLNKVCTVLILLEFNKGSSITTLVIPKFLYCSNKKIGLFEKNNLKIYLMNIILDFY